MTRRVLACLFFAGAITLLAKADGPVSSEKKDDSITKDSPIVVTLRDQQSTLKQQYKDIKAHVNEIAEQLKNSSDPEKQEKGKAISKALEDAGDRIELKFEKLEGLLLTPNQQKIDSAKTQIAELRRDLQDLIKQLKEADKGPDRKKEIAALSRILEEIKRLAREQETARTNTELNRRDKEGLGKEQNGITKDTGKVIGKGDAKGNPGGEAKNAGDAKGEGKNAGNDPKGEGKNDTDKPKADDKGKGEQKPGTDPKDPKGNPGGEAKGSKAGGDPKEGKGESKSGGMSGGDPKEGKGEAKDDPKKNDPKNPNDPKKEGDQPKEKSDSKGKSDGKGEPKDGKPSEGKGQPSESKSSQSGQQQAGGSKGSKQTPPPQDNGNQPKKEQFPGKQQVEEAQDFQKGAEKDIDKGDNDAAAKKQADAAKKLKDAQKELEARLRQLRKDEIDRILGDMLGRCNKMLAWQKDVRDETVRLEKTKKGRSTPDRADVNKGDELAKKEGDIIKVADDAIQLLREEGTSIAFPEVLDFVRNLMRDVKVRLSKTDPGPTTQATEEEIIRNLEEMIAALEKAKKENQQQPPPPGQPGQQNPNPGNKPLLQELQELKLIRNMQVSVYKMTEAYGQEYKGKEQAPAPEKAQTKEERDNAMSLKGYLDDLSKRQSKIFEVTNDLYKGKNK